MLFPLLTSADFLAFEFHYTTTATKNKHVRPGIASCFNFGRFYDKINYRPVKYHHPVKG